ncbi:phage tail protein [Phenylobacterium sp.]|uniref:phage tail protein n=1 Tax=Phenylobacterium sp. TaxID=1871053 RepID=UPI00301BE849
MAQLLALGVFPFSLPNLAFQDLQRRTSWRHGQTPRFGRRPATQFGGPDADKITLSGMVMPGLLGRLGALDELREMGDTGAAWPLVTGYGEMWGAFVIESLTEGRQIFLDDGAPRRADFTVELLGVDEDDVRDRTLPAGLRIRG